MTQDADRKPVLPPGVKVEPVTILSDRDRELIALLRWNEEEITRVFSSRFLRSR